MALGHGPRCATYASPFFYEKLVGILCTSQQELSMLGDIGVDMAVQTVKIWPRSRKGCPLETTSSHS